nr:hypothetical protein CFP56_70041 [Quercus suber]
MAGDENPEPPRPPFATVHTLSSRAHFVGLAFTSRVTPSRIPDVDRPTTASWLSEDPATVSLHRVCARPADSAPTALARNRQAETPPLSQAASWSPRRPTCARLGSHTANTGSMSQSNGTPNLPAPLKETFLARAMLPR